MSRLSRKTVVSSRRYPISDGVGRPPRCLLVLGAPGPSPIFEGGRRHDKHFTDSVQGRRTTVVHLSSVVLIVDGLEGRTALGVGRGNPSGVSL